MSELSEAFEISPEFCEKFYHGKAWPLPRLSSFEPVKDKYEVVIAGAGPAGLFLKLLLTRYGLGDASVLCVDPKERETDMGHADGIHERTIEILARLGLEHEVVRNGRPFIKVYSWATVKDDKTETNIVPMGSNRYEFSPSRFHTTTTIHQGRMERCFSQDLQKHGGNVTYQSTVTRVTLDEQTDPEYPVVVEMEQMGKIRTVRAKYVVGADGAHSVVRRSVGINLAGSSKDEIWGVIDFAPDSDFPDIRRLMRLVKADNLTDMQAMMVPREKSSDGSWICRIYTRMDGEEDVKQRIIEGDEMREAVRRKKAAIKQEQILAKIQEIFHPYYIKPKAGTKPLWFATYVTGQRLADRFLVEDTQNHPRIFLIGDACHTHSPRQGQGLNISVGDAYYLSWRLAYTLMGLTKDSTKLLRTYEEERRAWAAKVVFADKRWNEEGLSWQLVREEMRQQATGCGTEEKPSFIVSDMNDSVEWRGKDLLMGTLRTGRRVLNVNVLRWADETPRDIHDEFPSDGRYHVFMLASTDFPHGKSRAAVEQLCSLTRPDRYHLVNLVVVHPHTEPTFDWKDLPVELKKHADMRIFNADQTVYDTYGVNKEEGAIALIRPDGMVAMTVTIDNVQAIQDHLESVIGATALAQC